jgi:hypothetical protein
MKTKQQLEREVGARQLARNKGLPDSEDYADLEKARALLALQISETPPEDPGYSQLKYLQTMLNYRRDTEAIFEAKVYLAMVEDAIACRNAAVLSQLAAPYN